MIAPRYQAVPVGHLDCEAIVELIAQRFFGDTADKNRDRARLRHLLPALRGGDLIARRGDIAIPRGDWEGTEGARRVFGYGYSGEPTLEDLLVSRPGGSIPRDRTANWSIPAGEVVIWLDTLPDDTVAAMARRLADIRNMHRGILDKRAFEMLKPEFPNATQKQRRAACKAIKPDSKPGRPKGKAG